MNFDYDNSVDIIIYLKRTDKQKNNFPFFFIGWKKLFHLLSLTKYFVNITNHHHYHILNSVESVFFINYFVFLILIFSKLNGEHLKILIRCEKKKKKKNCGNLIRF